MKRVVLLYFMMLAFASANAQVVINSLEEFDKERSFVIEKGKSNWFISFGPNANIYVGQQDNQVKFLNRIGGGGSIFFGKWITPWVGFKMGVDAAQYRGAVMNGDNGNFIVKDELWKSSVTRHNVQNLMVQRFFAFNPNIDIFFSLFNSLGKVKEKRVFDMVLSVGAGFFVNSGYKVDPGTNLNGRYNTYAPSLNFGLLNKFRLCEALDLGIEFKAAWLSNEFDGQIWNGEKYREGDLAASLGISLAYKFKPRRNTAYVPIYYKDAAEAKACLDDLNKLKSEQDKLLAENERIKNENRELQNTNLKLRDSINSVKPVVKKAPVRKEIIAVIEYKIGVSTLTAADRKKLKQAAEIIKSHPDKTYEICGYADKTTGSKEINARLRNARANRAIDQLLYYGVNRNQILKATNDGDLPGTSTRAIVIQQVECN